MKILLVMLALLPLNAVSSDTASGTFAVKGTPTSFKYAYPFWKTAWNEPTKQYLHVLLSDVPVAPNALPKNDDAIARMAGLVRDEKIHAFELRFDSASAEKLYDAEQGAIYHNGVSPGRQGVNGMLRYERLSAAGGMVRGKVMSDPAFASTLGWSIEATFEVAVPRR